MAEVSSSKFAPITSWFPIIEYTGTLYNLSNSITALSIPYDGLGVSKMSPPKITVAFLSLAVFRT